MRKWKQRIWLVPFVAAVVVAVFGWWTHEQVKKSIQGKLETELKTVLSANIKSLEIWLDTQQKTAAAVASDEKLRELVSALAALHAKRGPGRRPPFGGRGEFGRGDGPPNFDRRGGPGGETNRPPGFRFDGGRGGRGGGGGPGGGLFGGGPGAPDDEMQKLGEELRRYLSEKVRAFGYASYIVLGKDGWPMAAQRESRMDEQIPPPLMHRVTNVFEEGQAQLLPSFRASTTNLPIMAVTSPVRDTNNLVVAALGLTIRPESDFTAILSVSQVGDSGETYAFNRSGALVTKSRFDDQLREIGLLSKDTNMTSVLNVELRDPGADLTRGGVSATNRAHQPFTLIARRAAEGRAGVEIKGMADYRGVQVVGAWQWLPDYNIGVATQMDVAEAYRPLRQIQRLFTALLVLLVLAAGGLLGFTYVNGQLRKRTRELGQYTLNRKIGEGGMGAVYLARHALLRRPTAVKLIVPELAGEESLAMFEQEVQLTSELTHPNTIQIYDYGHTPEGVFYYAMEYLDGLNLHTLITVYGPQPEGRIIHILKQVCGSLNEAHVAGLIHRDIKPANVFLTRRSGAYDFVKVLDFGLVKTVRAVARTQVADRRFAGTPLYMSPESVERPETADARSDIYALGAMAYHILTGTEVFRGKTVDEICAHHVSSVPQPPSERMGRLCDPGLEAIILRCLAKNPVDRPQTVEELWRELDACAATSTWTDEAARAWWEQVRQPARETTLSAPAEAKARGVGVKTMQIDFQERV